MVWRFGDYLDAAQFIALTERVSKDPAFRSDCLVLAIFDKNTDLNRLDPEGLRRIQDAEVEIFGGDPSEETTPGVVICPDQMTAIIVSLYQELGETNPDFKGDIRTCQSRREAERILQIDLAGIEMPRYALRENL